MTLSKHQFSVCMQQEHFLGLLLISKRIAVTSTAKRKSADINHFETHSENNWLKGTLRLTLM